MNQSDIKQYVLDNPALVSMRESESHPGLYVLKYKKRVFYDALWNNFLEECRGTIVDTDFNIIARPFTKIYNFRVEEKSPILSNDTLVTAYRKVNGFMCSLTWANNDILVSTTGSTDSPYVVMAKEMMLKHACWQDWQLAVLGASGFTLMFEVCHPSDPHIVVEKPGMYFIGWRENSWESKVNGFECDEVWKIFAQDTLKCHPVESYHMTVGELVEESKKTKTEGFVAYTANGQAFKIKSPYYLVNKWVARNPRTDKLMRDDFKNQIDEEYYGLLDHIREKIEMYTTLSEQERLQFVREFLSK